LKEFLNQQFWDITYLNWILCAFFIFLSLLFKRVISNQLARIVIYLTKKWGSQYSADLFKRLMILPIKGLVTCVLLFLAVTRLLPKIDMIIIFDGLNTASKIEGAENIHINKLSLFDAFFTIYLVFLIYYGFLLLSRILELIIKIKLRNAIIHDDKSRQQILPLMKDILKVVIWFFGLIVFLGVIFKVNLTALFAGLGIGGVAIAFAAKESLENLIASFMVLVDKPFTIGDWIKVDGTEGVIEKVGFRSSRLRTFDKSLIIIPNRKLIDSKVENFSERGVRRVRQVVGSVYGVSQEQIKSFIQDFTQSIQKIDGVMPNATANLDGFGDSQIDIVIVYFVKVNTEVNFLEVKQDVNLLIYEKMYQYLGGFAFPTQVEIKGEDINNVQISN